VTEAGRFALRGVAYGLGLFGLLRLNWVEAHALVPFTGAQAAVAVDIFGPSATPLAVTLACSGADALTLCLGAVLAYPARWRSRLAGVTAGITLVIGLNIARLGTLGLVSGLPGWFNALHLYIWPALLTLAVTAYVFAWMHVTDRSRLPGVTARLQRSHPDAGASPTRRFVVLTVTLMILFLAASPLYLQSAGVLALAGFIARSSAALLDRIGVEAHATSNVLWTMRGGFLVTQECISTPLIPIYLAAAIAYSRSRRRLIFALFAAGPLFVLLGIARLLVVALPGMVTDAPLFLVHAFYQLLLAAVVVFVAARWRHDGNRSWYHAFAGVGAGIAFFYFVGPSYTRLVTAWTALPIEDPQGAIAVLPAFQVALFLALWVAACLALGWRRFVAGLALLEMTQAAALLLLHAAASHPGLTAHVRDIRGWAVVGPLLIVAVVANVAAPRR
jgi:exosortase/archaeosortase family protein